MTMPVRRTRSKHYAKKNDSWMIGVGHDGMNLSDRFSCPGMHYIPCGSRLVEDLHTNSVVSAQKSSIAIVCVCLIMLIVTCMLSG